MAGWWLFKISALPFSIPVCTLDNSDNLLAKSAFGCFIKTLLFNNIIYVQLKDRLLGNSLKGTNNIGRRELKSTDPTK